MFTDKAKAKINLTLDILGKREDGYHALNSLVTFADIYDELSFTPNSDDHFTLTQQGFVVEGENIILKAATLFKSFYKETPFGAFHLVKNLPIASGIGGGSSDAACALRLLSKALGKPVDLSEIAKELGADVSVCLTQKTRFMSGIGHDLGEEIKHETFYFLLVNPLKEVSTKAIFEKLNAPPFKNTPHLEQTDYTKGKNDLQPIAIKLLPEIGEILAAFQTLNPIVARMSGSGATCFAIFKTREEVKSAEKALKKLYPSFWIAIE